MKRYDKQTSKLKAGHRFMQLLHEDSFDDYSTIYFSSLSELLDYCNLKPNQFAKQTGYHLKSIYSWLKKPEAPMGEDILKITSYLKDNQEWIYLDGAKDFYFHDNTKITFVSERARFETKGKNKTIKSFRENGTTIKSIHDWFISRKVDENLLKIRKKLTLSDMDLLVFNRN